MGSPAVRRPLVAGTTDLERPGFRWHIFTEAGTAACAPRTLHLNPEIFEAARVYDEQRCRRPGCRVHWDTVPGRDRGPTRANPEPVTAANAA